MKKSFIYETHAEQLQVEENKARHDKQNTHYEKLIQNLSDILKQDLDSQIIINRLAELGFKTEEGFKQKSVEKIRKSVHELITYLEEESNGILKVTTNSVYVNIVKVTDITTKTAIENVDKIRSTLKQVTEGRFLSIDAINKALKELNGIQVEIPADEIARLNSLFPTKLSSETLAKIKMLKYDTEGGECPLVMQLPAKVMVDSQEKPFTILTMQEIMLKASKADSNLKSLYISDYVPIEVKNKIWDSYLGIWTSDCLKGTKNNDQLKRKNTIYEEIDADIILAMALQNISGQELAWNTMRLNTRDTRDIPLLVNTNDNVINLVSLRNLATPGSNGGIGASFRISS